MKKTFLLFAISMLVSGIFSTSSAQETSKFKFYGFVRNDLYYNSRNNEQTTDGLYNFYPKPIQLDGNGNDLNDFAQMEMLSVFSRVGVDIQLPDYKSAKISAKIESDFAGTSASYYLLRIRQAYVDIKMKDQSILVGQSWHPMFSSLCPTVVSINTGSPFQPFNRSPQIAYTRNLGKQVKFLSSALYEMQYTSFGPLGCSNVYMKNSLLPNLYGSFEYTKGKSKAGIGVDFKRLKPLDNSYVNSVSAMAYAGTSIGDLQIKGKVIYGQNLGDQIMIGGYAVSSVNTDGSVNYTNLNTMHSWINLVYGKDLQFGIFGGMSNHLGTNKSLSPDVIAYGRGYTASNDEMIKNLYRVSPFVSFNMGNIKLGIEYNLTDAEYGTLQSTGELTSTYHVANHRLVGLIMCSF